MKRETPLAPLFMALFCILVWGLSFAVTRDVVRQIPPLTLATLRFAIATALLWVLTRKHRQSVKAEDRIWLWALALTGISAYFAFENFGLKLTTASHASLIIATIPLGTELVWAWRRRQLPETTSWLGALVALSGIALLVGFERSGASVWGDLLMFGAVASWIAYTFLVMRLAGRYPNLLLTRWIAFIGMITLAPGAAVEIALLPIVLPGPAAWGQVLFLGVACSALAYDLWNRAVPALGPTVINNLLYLIPLIGVLGGIVFLNEPVTPALFFGGLLIFLGVFLARRG